MGDHFVLLVDRLLTEQTLEAAIQSRNLAKAEQEEPALMDTEAGFTPPKKNKNGGDGFSAAKMVECRICQDEDEYSNMETPCSCCGSLEYAHRKCIQRWCNEKGDTICEICLQQFKPGYTAPPKLFHYGTIPMNFRGNWEISRRDIDNQRFITMLPTNRDLSNSDYGDDYSASNARSMMYCRSVAIIFMVLLFLRHTLPIILTGVEQYSVTLFTLLLLRTAGIVLPLYVMLRVVTTFHGRRHQQVQEPNIPATGENVRVQSLQRMQGQMHLIHVQ